ncbi:MAG: SCO family protein [Proteobacteria bacterium]|nr:SCO family protein [Pseudomonadota bacterium]MCP4917387.1 SCO family protein [Pseudomonadota bacterium]
MRLFALIAGLLLATPALADEAPLPGDSVYQLEMPLTDSNGAAADLAAFRGQPVLITMFYASCGSACPLLIRDVGALLDATERKDVRVVMVTLAPDQDDPEALAALVERHGLDANWLVAASEKGRERELAATLGISYRELAGGHINHSSVITLLDSEGRPVARIDGLDQPSEPLLKALKEL